MTMVSTGEISIGGNATSGGLNRSINIELGRAATATSSLNESALRTLAGVPSGAISLSNFYGKSNTFSFTISTNQTNANLRTLAVNAGWNQSTKVIATIANGVYCSSNSTGTPGLTINGSFPNGVDLINGGFIIGMGGNGGAGAGYNGSIVNGSAGAAGGLALSVSVAVSITNNGTIGGGGGGGGGGATQRLIYTDGKANFFYAGGGGGGGGGRTNPSANSSGGSGGSITGNDTNRPGSAGGGGTVSGAGGGGAGGQFDASNRAGNGGAGGGWGSSGSSGSNSTGGTLIGPYSGGSAGGAVSGNSNVTWVAFGTRLGSIT